MHPFVLIPLGSAIAAAALAAAIAAREPRHRPNQLAAGLLASTSAWSLLQVLWCTAPDAHTALILARLSNLFSLALGPFAVHLLVELQPRLRDLRPWVGASWVVALACAVASVATPGVTAEMRPVPWGFTPAPGPASIAVSIADAVIPVYACLRWVWVRGERTPEEVARGRPIEWATVAVFAASILAEIVLPLAGFELPRLGGTPTTFWGTVTFFTIRGLRTTHFDPRSFAREILETLPVGVLLVRADGRIRATNGKLRELAGCEARDLVGRSVEEILVGDETRADTPGAAHERELLRADGLGIPVSVSRSTLRDPAGDELGEILMLRDLRELVSLRGRLVTSGRLAAVGQLAAGIAHEINNPIAYVRANMRVMEAHWQEAERALRPHDPAPEVTAAIAEGHELIAECFDGVERVTSIVRDVGGFSRAGHVAHELSDLEQLLDASVRVVGSELRERARIERHYADAPLVPCVPQELMQVFLNLLLNANQALDGPGTIRLITQVNDAEVGVIVEDSGSGIERDVQDRIFEPFYTTKPVGEGTGLGLAISKQIVERHGGHIDVDSAAGGGARFGVWLPRTAVGESVH